MRWAVETDPSVEIIIVTMMLCVMRFPLAYCLILDLKKHTKWCNTRCVIFLLAVSVFPIQKPEICWSQMNKGDVFILDLGDIIYVWNGESCSRTERIKAMEIARSMRDDRGSGNIVVLEDGEETPDDMGEDEFEVCFSTDGQIY